VNNQETKERSGKPRASRLKPHASSTEKLTRREFGRRIERMATRMKKSLRNPSRKLRTSADPLADCAAEFKDLRQLCGKNVRAWRERRGLTLDQLSERCGVSSNTIYRVERGWGDRSIVIHAKIAEGLVSRYPNCGKVMMRFLSGFGKRPKSRLPRAQRSGLPLTEKLTPPKIRRTLRASAMAIPGIRARWLWRREGREKLEDRSWKLEVGIG